MASLRDFKPADDKTVTPPAAAAVVDPPEPAAVEVAEPEAVEVEPVAEPAAEVAGAPADGDEDPLVAAGDFRVSPEELAAMPEAARKKAKSLEADYTRKTTALAEDRRALEARQRLLEEQERKVARPASGGDEAARTLATAMSAGGHAPLRVLLGEDDDWDTHIPLPEKLAIDELSDEDLYDPSKLRTAMRQSIEQGTRARAAAVVKAMVEPYRQQQARVQQDEAIATFVAAHPGMESVETRKAIYAVADRLGLKGRDGLASAYKVWAAEGGKPTAKVAAAAPARTTPVVVARPASTSAAPTTDVLAAQVASLQKKLARAPADAARALAAEHVGKSGLAAGDQEPVMPPDLDPEARQKWIAAHPKAAANMRRLGVKGLRSLG